MAKVMLNSALTRLSGRVGDVIFRTINGRTHVYAAPRPSTLPPTPAQLAARGRFAVMARARAVARAEARPPA